jgi:outer membrane protein OmpA-like peptidoglycan-associated protein
MVPTYDTRGKLLDPRSVFIADKSIDAAMMISPEAAVATSGGKVGTGAEGSRKGAKALLSTKTADSLIVDVYFVRADFFAANKAKVEAFVRALLKGEEALRDLMKSKGASPGKERFAKLAKDAGQLLDSKPEDIEAMIGDARLAGHEGNLIFFTGLDSKGLKHLRTFDALNDEIQACFIGAGLMKGTVSVKQASWDYKALAKGLKYAGQGNTGTAIDPTRASAAVERRVTSEAAKWDSEFLFQDEIFFAPNQDSFPAKDYEKNFLAALQKAQTNGGAVITVEGHSDPWDIIRYKAGTHPNGNKTAAEIAEMEEAAKDLSLKRADSV